MITNMVIRGFKGLPEFTIKPGHMNLVIGANGTGKSNLAELVRFIARLPRDGLKYTMNDMGGENAIRTRQGAGAPMKFHVEFELGQDNSRGIDSVHYGFELAQSKGEMRITREWLTATVHKRKPGRPKTQGYPLFDPSSPVELTYTRNGSQINHLSDDLERLEPDFVRMEADTLILSAFSQAGELKTVTDFIGSWRAYNIDAALSKLALGKGDIELNANGDNLVPFLIRMINNPSTRNSLLTQIREPVPYIKDIRPDFGPAFHTLRLSETDSGNEFQLSDMSDGTVRLLGLFAIFLQKIPPAVILLEEPENALHRYAVNRVLDLAYKVATREKFPSQVFLTSHSPVVADEVLRADKLLDKQFKTCCFISQREKTSIVPAPNKTIDAIANNMGRPSERSRNGNMGDRPIRPHKPVIDDEAEV